MYLQRVWNGLTSQVYEKIEWIVADDGSSDNTQEVVRALAENSRFPVTLVSASVRIGKARMDNEMVAQSQGEFVLWCDSDDYLLPNAIEKFVDTWDSIPKDKRDKYVGVTAICATETNGVIENPFPDVEYMDLTWNDLAEKYKVTGDMIYFTRTSALKENNFPEVDFVIPESVVWAAIGSEWVRFVPEVVKINEYVASNRISFSGKMEYSRGRAYALASIVKDIRKYPQGLKVRYWRLITFIRYCIHGEIKFHDAIHLWGDNSTLIEYLLMYPFAWLLAVKDVLQRKVCRTHREFIEASKVVRISIERYAG